MNLPVPAVVAGEVIGPGDLAPFDARFQPWRHPAKVYLQRMAANIPLTDGEQAAIDDGQAALDRLLTRLADVPTPAGPTPRQLGTPTAPTFLPITDVTMR